MSALKGTSILLTTINYLSHEAGAKDYPSLPHYKVDSDAFRFDRLEASLQQEIWSSKDWTWAVFLREPAERLLSAYLDKIAKGGWQQKILDALGINATAAVFTFENFVQRLAMNFNETGCVSKQGAANQLVLTGMTGLNWCSNPREFSVSSSWRLFVVLKPNLTSPKLLKY